MGYLLGRKGGRRDADRRKRKRKEKNVLKEEMGDRNSDIVVRS